MTTITERAKALIDRLDPDGSRKSRTPRPFMAEVCGLPNSGKTTLINDLYDAFKPLGLVATRSVEGADVIPPPRVLPDYNLRTWMHAMANALDFQHNANLHAVLFDRGPMDFAVRCELFVGDGVMAREEAELFKAVALSPRFLNKFDLHVFLMCDADTALARKFGADHAAHPERYGKTTNPETMEKLIEAHQRVYQGADAASRLVWIDTSHRDQEAVKAQALDRLIEAFEARDDI